VIFETPRVKEWLDQFRPPHRYLAEYLLAKLRYVSLQQVEAWVQQEVRALLGELCEGATKPAIALFPVAKPFIHEFNKDKETKAPSDSSGRIAHMLRNLERGLPPHIELNPRIESMRSRRVKHIIFVDDFIGTGDRFIKSWRQTVPRTVKSWISLGWCRVWVLSYAAHESGLRRIERELKAIERARIRTGITIDKSFICAQRNLIQLCLTGGRPSAHPKKPFGYGKLCSPIVFQYGCPNNTPGILWNRDSSKTAVRPLFPNRSVPDDLFGLFGVDHSAASMAEELWLSRQYRLALRYLDDPEALDSSRVELTMLAYLANGRDRQSLRAIMVLDEVEFEKKLHWLSELGLIANNLEVTRFGFDVLQRGGRKQRSNPVASGDYCDYYPSSFMGFQRNV